MRYLSDFRSLNKQLKRKPYTKPKSNEILLELDIFQYATLFHLNMGYYHIRLTEDGSNSCTIILSWIKYCSKLLSIGVGNSLEILKQKMNNLFQ